MVNIGGRRGVEGGWDTDISHIHLPQAQYSGAVGVYMSYLRILCTVAGVQSKGGV